MLGVRIITKKSGQEMKKIQKFRRRPTLHSGVKGHHHHQEMKKNTS